MITHAMASIGISASIQRPSCSSHITQPKPSPPRSLASLVTPNVEDHKLSENPKQLRVQTQNPKNSDEQSRPRFCDERWKNGTWDLNMFVKQGRMDWDSVIVSEAKRRKYVEMHPEASTNDEPVIFRSSIIPLWAWILHSHLPQAELLNGLTLSFTLTLISRLTKYCVAGRAAMVGFFTAYVVDALTGLDLVGQTGNFICKTALLLAVVGVLLFQRKEDAENIRKLADEATFYDKQWQASWQNPDDVE